MISITKEKTAKIIPNAVAVSTEEETHTFTSLISRDATFKAMTKAWRKAIARSNIISVVRCFWWMGRYFQKYFI